MEGLNYKLLYPYGTFKYHMTLRGKGVCSNRQSAVMWGRSLAKSSFGLQKNAIWCDMWKGGWLKTSEYRCMGGGALKLLKNTSYNIWTFPIHIWKKNSLFR